MDSLKDYLQKDFTAQREVWEKLLQSELKTDDISNKTTKRTHEGSFSTLGLSATTHLLKVTESWKKASQTYITIPSDMKIVLQDDLDNGVRLFFFDPTQLTQKSWDSIETQINSFPKYQEVVVMFLNESQIQTNARFQLISSFVSGRESHLRGGNNTQELGLLVSNLIERLKTPGDIYLALYLDSQVFKSIAKIRAARLLTQKVLEESGEKREFHVTALTSYREWTLYERYSNMLRNVASVSAGLMGGADWVQSAGYMTLMESEIENLSIDEGERSRRMARNTSHILALESMLGVVEDPAFGSFHLESLTEEYAQSGWEYMQTLQKLPESQRLNQVEADAAKIREKREQLVDTRRHILAGMNEYPDVKETLNLSSLPQKKFYRVAHRFEDLRLMMEKTVKKPAVYIAIFGNYAALNARMNFAKNYFELLGLKVEEGEAFQDINAFESELQKRSEEIIILCSTDEGYESLKDISVKADEKFIAGKAPLQGFENLYAGQNAYEVLARVAQKWGKK